VRLDPHLVAGGWVYGDDRGVAIGHLRDPQRVDL
jgi:hypothetical protein